MELMASTLSCGTYLPNAGLSCSKTFHTENSKQTYIWPMWSGNSSVRSHKS